jgi:fibronectin-binding autotransporter adhesin
MNRTFRIIWSRALHAWVVASELATSQGKGGRSVERRAPALPLRLTVLAALVSAYAPAHAASRYWDPNGTAVNWGGTATWNTTSAFWSPNADGVSGPYSAWSNAAFDDAFFGGTAGAVTLGGAISAHNLTFQATGYSLTGGSLVLGGVTRPTLSVTTGAATIASPITSASGIAVSGAGTLTLNGSNDFGTGIDINGGTLVLGAANTFTGAINATGGNLNVGTAGDAALGGIGNQINLGSGRSFTSTGAISSSRTVNLMSGIGSINGSGTGSAFYTGAGGLSVGDGISLTNNANNYQGQTSFPALNGNWTHTYNAFTSIADLGVASALGAPTTVANGTIIFGPGGGQGLGPSELHYTGSGNSSNRNWSIRPGSYAGAAFLYNSGSGTLRLTGDIAVTGGAQPFGFVAESADMDLLGVISSNTGRSARFSSGAGHTIRLGTANTFSGQAQVVGAGKTEAALLSNAGVAGSLGTGQIAISSSGTVQYVGAGEASNKTWLLDNGTLNSSGTGALSLSGTMGITNTATLGGSYTGADNLMSGVISGTGNLRGSGQGTWVLTGANTYTGSTIVDGGVLRAGTANAFGGSTVAQVNGGTLDLNDFSRTFSTLSGSGGAVDLGSATLTLDAPSGTSSSYAGNITGTGGLTKLGASTQTLTGANTYTGATTIGGGTLALDFSPAGGPGSNIIGSASTLTMSGGTLSVTGATGEANTQTFNGLNVTAGNNTITAKSGTGGSSTVNLGAINRTGGLINFNLPASGNITTSNTMLGGWATVNGTDYAKVVGGNIQAFTDADYTDKDNAANWLDNEFITDVAGFYGTVTGSRQLGGLRYTVAKATTVTVQPGDTLGVDGTIIVAPTVLNTNQVITGGKLTGANGGDLGIQQNSTGNFTVASQIVDNGTPMGFTKAGTGLVTLANTANTYTGATRVAQGSLSVANIGNGGQASSIGASSAGASNLVLEGSTLSYTGGTATSDRGFTLAKSGAITAGAIEVTNAGANLTFGGQVVSADGAGLTKSGPGTLTLANPANGFTGVVTVTGGLLGATTLGNGGQASSIGAGGSASANLVLNGGGLQYTGTSTGTDRGFTLSGTGGIVDVSNAGTTLTDSGVIVGTGRLTKNGSGTLVLSGANTYSGGNTVNAGVLRAGGTNVFGMAGGAATMSLANTPGATLDLNNFDNTIGPLNGGGASGGNVTLGSATLTINSGNGNYSGVISGSGGVTRTGGGTQTFNGCNNTYTGPTSLQGGSLSTNCLANGGQASGIGASSAASTNLVFSNAILTYTGTSVTTDRGFQLQGGVGAIEVTQSGATVGFSGPVIGGGSFRKDGAGTIVLSGSNTYTGGNQVTGGVLRAGSVNAFGPSGHMTLNNTAGVLLDLAGFNTTVTSLIGGGSTGGNIALGGATLTLNSVDTRSYAGAITGPGNLVKAGAGTQAFTACNSSYTGGTTISAGVLEVNCLENGGVNSSIGASTSAATNLVVNGTLRYVGTGSRTDRQFTIGTGGGTLDASGSGIVEFTSTSPVALAGANVSRTLTLTGTNTGYNLFAGELDNNGAGVTSLTKAGTGTWRLTNANSTYTGITRINGGVLSVDQMANGGQASSIGASSSAATNLVIGNGSTLRYTGDGDSTDRQFTLDTGVTYIESSGTGALKFTNTGAVALTGSNTARTIALGGTYAGDNTMGGAIGNNGTGATTLAKNDSGTWILTGNNTFTGNTVINDGNLMIGNGGTTGNAGAGNVIVDSPTSTLSLNRSDTFTFGGTLSGPGTLAQVGTGTSVLTASGNQIGATKIAAGELEVNGGLVTPTVAMTGTSALTVNGTLQGTGGTASALSGDAGAQTVTVGSAGSLLASGDLGDGNDTVDLSGTLNTGGGSLALGNGDDTLALHDGAQMLGGGINAAGGGGTDTLLVDTALGYTLDGAAIDTFDILTKQNTGTLTLTGAHDFAAGTHIDGGSLAVDGTLATPSVSMADNTVLAVNGVLDAGAGATAVITGSAGSNTINVGSGAILAANGDLGDGNDTLDISGELDTGAATLGLGAGDDQVTLHSGAMLTGTGIDAGAGSNDRLTLDSATNMIFDGARTAGFEFLEKDNTGSATITGGQSFSGGTALHAGTLNLTGSFTTPDVTMGDGTVLNVDGSLDAGGGAATTIAGSAGSNTVGIAAGSTVVANGDLDAGDDVLDVAGTLDTAGGTLALGDGNDTLTIHEHTNIVGTVDAGAGNDTLDTHIDTEADLGAVQGFETLGKTGAGVLNINGPLSSDFTAVSVSAGILNVATGGSVTGGPGTPLTTTVAAGATLNVDGSYGCGAGNDTMTVAGTVSGSGSIDLCGGDDTLTLRDGAVLTNTISGGTGTGDTLVLDSASALSVDTSRTTNFEELRKENTGTATLTGVQAFTGGAAIDGGTLDVEGTLSTPTIALADGTTLSVGGVVDGGAGTATQIAGGAGGNTVSILAGGTLLATGDLGAGEDTLDVAGTLDTGGGIFGLGDGDDNFIVHDGTVVGTVDGGAGLDTRTYDINTTANLGALLNFEGVTKTGTGVLNVTGPGATDLQVVEVLGGTMNIGAGASIVATAGSTLAGTVATGATLNVDGAYGCGTGNDTLDVSGTVSGGGQVNLCGGDDTLTLHDGANLAIAHPIDGDAGTGDKVVLDTTSGMALDAGQVANFELLQKLGTGNATLTGPHAFSGGTALDAGSLTVTGSLATPTVSLGDDTVLHVVGTLAGNGGTAAVLTGSAGVNTVDVAAGGLLVASGDLGAGSDVLDVAGTLDTQGSTLSLGDGSDTFTIHDGTTVLGTVDGGAGLDTFNPDIDTSATLGALTSFEVLTKTGTGLLNVVGPGQSDFQSVNVLEGTLAIGPAGAIAGVQDAIVAGGATLELDGNLGFTAGSDSLTVAGTMLGDGLLDMGDGDDTLTIKDGANLSGLMNPVSGGAGNDTFVADLAGSAVLGGAIDFETLTKTNTGTLHVNGPAQSAFATVNVAGGTLDVGVAGSLSGVQLATVAQGASLHVDGSVLFTPGDDRFVVAGNVGGIGTIDMLDGDDTLVLQDGADLSGMAMPIDGGAGNDTLQADIAGNAVLGGAANFETLSKTNAGTLTVAGPATSDFDTVNVAGGTLDIGPAGSMANIVATTVAAGATLNVDGSYAGSAGDDTMSVSGTVSGSGPIAFGDGNDVLALHDGANMDGYTGALDGGTGNDTVVLDNAGALTFGAGPVTGFENLAKSNTGVATLLGPQAFSGGTTITGGELAVAGSLSTPTVALGDGTTLTVGGSLDAGGGATAITGSARVNTVNITGSALATGDLGAGADVLDVRGILDTQGGVFALGDGDDSFVVHDGTVVNGTVDGGAGLDTRVYDINQTADLGALVNFEGVTKTGTGVLHINGPAATALQEVSVLGGTLDIAAGGSVTAIPGTSLDAIVAAGATLQVNGSFGCGDGADHMTVAGTVSGSGTIDLCGGDDTLTLQDGAVLANTIDGGDHDSGDTVALDNAGAMTYDASRTIHFEYLRKDNTGGATLVGTQAFAGGTTVAGGALTVAGELDTPTVALADGTTLNVSGTLQAEGAAPAVLTGSAGANTVTVAAGGTLRAGGELGAGDDVLDVAGTLDTAGGTVDLGDGDDRLTIHDNTVLAGTVAGGAGNDTFNADIATVANLGAVQSFETLSKTGQGVLNVNGPASSDFTTVDVREGVLDVTTAGSIAAAMTTVSAGATLQVEGRYTGTDGNDSFTSMGTVRGAFDFGNGDDVASFVGGDPSGVTALAGGAGNDRLSFGGLTLDSVTLPVLSGWERMELNDASRLNLDTKLDLAGGVLAIDGTSTLDAGAGGSLVASVENAGTISTGSNRLAIGGDYTGLGGRLDVGVATQQLTAGGLDIAGDVRGTTAVSFDADGSKLSGAGKVSILVISSPNDDPATDGRFVPADAVNGTVRLDGSAFPWTFGQAADHNWYLDAQAGLLPEFPAYAVLPTLGALMARQDDDLIHQRLAGVRDTEGTQCGNGRERTAGQAGENLYDDCHGLWVAATGSNRDLGGDPGFGTRGSDVGMYVGFDYAGEDEARAGRIGAFLGYVHGSYWTTGGNSTGMPVTGHSRIRLDTPVGGWYGSLFWNNGTYLDTVVSGQRIRARVRTSDGFEQAVRGGSVTVSTKLGRRMELDNGWSIEPSVQVAATDLHWNDIVDKGNRGLTFDNHWIGTARAGFRTEKMFTTDSGATIKPWVSVALQDSFNQKSNALNVLEPGEAGPGMALPNQDLGLAVRVDAGVEAKLNDNVSVFGVLSETHELRGSDYRERAANLGVRVRW